MKMLTVKSFRLLQIMAAFCLLTVSAPAAEVLTNRSFDVADGAGWGAVTNTQFSTPGAAYLHPIGGYIGTVLWQDLDVAGASSATGTASVVLSTASAPAGNTIAVYLEYTIAGGTTNRLLLFNPNNSDISVPTTFSTNFALPDTAQRITRLSVDKTTNGSFYAQEFSLDVTVAAPPGLPEPFYGFITDGKVTITGHTGSTGGAIVIPGTLSGCPVTTISHAAFEYWDNLTSLTVPASVTFVGPNAFANCTNLAGVCFQGNAPEIAADIFDSGSKAIVYYLQGTTGWSTSFGGRPAELLPVVINGGFETGTLANWTGGAITNGGARTGVYASAIDNWGPPGFLSQEISTRLLAGVDYRFTAYINVISNKTGIEMMPVYIPHLTVGATSWSTNYYVTVSNIAGLGWQKLELVRSFAADELTTNVYLTIGGMGRFLMDDISATNVISASSPYNYTTNSDDTITITGYSGPGGAVEIPSSIDGKTVTGIVGAFIDCTSLTRVTIPVGVTTIGFQAFQNCTSLTNVTIPSSVTNLGNMAFMNCFGLSSVTVPNSVTSIGDTAFMNCSGLANVTIGGGVTNLGSYTFESCTNLTGVYFRGNAPFSVGDSVFIGCSTNATVYHLAGATGWPTVPAAWAGLKTALWITDPVYLLTINSGTGGGSYTNKERITITASNAPSGKTFDRWTGSTLYVASVTSSPTTVTMPAANITLTATYKAAYYALTVRGGTGSGSFTNGQKVTIAATVPVGMKFACWNDGITNASRSITMPPEPVTYTANFTDIQKPTVSITLPTAALRVSNSVYTVKGTATDNGVMTGVFCRVNSGEWILAATTNLTTNVWKSWSVPLTLTAGSNLVQAYSMDTAGNISATSSVSCTYAVPGTLIIATNGLGTVTRAPATAVEIGQTYTLTATPGTGCGFINWAGEVTGTNKVVTFKMTSNTTVIANFADNVKPTVAITLPTAALKVSNAVYAVRGTATDNKAVVSVWVQLNSNGWIQAIGTNSWTNTVTLTAGPNTIRAYSMDAANNCSATSSVICTYGVPGVLTIQTNGVGTVARAPATAVEIGQTYTLTATPGAGYGFANWAGEVTGTNKVVTFKMTSNTTVVANFADNVKPTVAITLPTAALKVSNAVYTVRGTATDNGVMTGVFCRANSGEWTLAATTNLTTNAWKSWSAPLTLTAGSNLVQAYSTDSAGNISAVSSVSCTYVVPGTLTITTNGLGTVTRAPATAVEIGQTYTLTATPGTGYGFVNWTGEVTGTNKVVTFKMTSNTTVVANFADNVKPTVAITLPTASLRISNEVYTVKGTASDNGVMTGVYCRVNSGAWTNAVTTNAWKSWSVPVTLTAGSNLIQACSADSAGNVSAFASVSCTYVVTAAMTVQKTGSGSVAPDYNGQILEVGKNYTMTAAPAVGYTFVNWTYGIGGDTATNKAAITFLMQSNLVLTANFDTLQNLSEEGLSALSVFADTNSTFNGDPQLIADAATAFDLAAKSAPNNYTNRIYNAVTMMMNLINDPAVRSQAAAYGVNLDDLFNPTCVFPTNAPPVDTSVDRFATIVLPVIDKAWTELNTVPATWTGRIEISTNRFPVDESVWVDAGDVAAMKACLKGLRASIGLLQSYSLNVDYRRIEDPVVTSNKSIAVDGLIADWTNVPRSLLTADWPDSTGPGNSTMTVTQEVAVVLDGAGSNVALLVTSCPLKISDECGISFDLRLSNGGSFSETRDHHIELWTSTNGFGNPVIAGLVYIGTNSQAVSGLEAEMVDGVLEIKFPVQDGLVTSQVTIEKVSCWVHFYGAGWDKWWNTDWSGPQSVGETPIPILRASHPALLSKVRNTTSLAGAKTDLMAALNSYLAADTLIGNRSGDNALLLHLVDFNPADPVAAEDRLEKRSRVEIALSSLSAPVQLEGDEDIEGTLTRPVFLGAFFTAPYITTNILPTGLKGTFGTASWSAFPNPTLNGIFPGMTSSNLNKYVLGYTRASVETVRNFSTNEWTSAYQLQFGVETTRKNMTITNVTVSGSGISQTRIESSNGEWFTSLPVASGIPAGTVYTFTVYFADGTREVIYDKINTWITVAPTLSFSGTTLTWNNVSASVPNADHYAVYTSYGYRDLPLSQTSLDMSELGYKAGASCSFEIEIVNKNWDKAARTLQYIAPK